MLDQIRSLSMRIPITFLLLATLFQACEDPFDYHPWEVDIPGDERDLNYQEISKIQQSIGLDTTTYNFAVFGDPHYYYTDTRNILEHIANDPSIRFVIVVGDITDQALMDEFVQYAEMMEESGIPHITLIGNHDHLANGRTIFEEMFGPRNMMFTVGGVRFVLFDNNEFESSVAVDYPWLYTSLSQAFDGQTIVFMHVPPVSDQLEGLPRQELENVMQATRPDDVYMGHIHRYRVGVFPDGTRWTTSAFPPRRSYLKVFVTPDTTYHQKVEL